MKYLVGDTIRLTVEFTDFSEALVDPALVKFITYDRWYQVIEEIVISDTYKVSTGKYYYDFIIPANSGNVIEEDMYYEWYGEIDGKPTIDRKKIKKVFII